MFPQSKLLADLHSWLVRCVVDIRRVLACELDRSDTRSSALIREWDNNLSVNRLRPRTIQSSIVGVRPQPTPFTVPLG